MTHYEELGVSPSAATEEIRQAHRKLARLFHPDRIQDDELRLLAETQMKRLNEACAELCDPHRRMQYDLSLVAGIFEVLPRQARNAKARSAFPDGRWGWGMAGVAGVLAVFLILATKGNSGSSATDVATPQTVESMEANAGPEEPESQEILANAMPTIETLREENLELRREVDRRISQRDAAQAEVEQLNEELALRLRAGRPQQRTVPESSPNPANDSEPAAEAAPETRPDGEKGLTGTWFFVPPRTPAATGDLYPPEYIEAVIRESEDRIDGRYRGRFRVTDRPISPEVVFQFEGVRNEEGSYRWNGLDGASGEVRLTLLPDDTLRVNWHATKLGQQMSLASGTAVLVRRRQR